ncbi:hypothetical protein BJ508DRAFT_411692 [Ascobolus immersus RN42]|uniref:DUF8035 domain-containing protein n=1 Tax=Ascobolus immersus RN42 TaxID=1160509 RepID=A0A3N4IJS2_ASCIM|nr:hypothetical protein BJ508DRAFT_411692 [Ascobolus immersus RN42]
MPADPYIYEPAPPSPMLHYSPGGRRSPYVDSAYGAPPAPYAPGYGYDATPYLAPAGAGGIQRSQSARRYPPGAEYHMQAGARMEIATSGQRGRRARPNYYEYRGGGGGGGSYYGGSHRGGYDSRDNSLDRRAIVPRARSPKERYSGAGDDGDEIARHMQHMSLEMRRLEEEKSKLEAEKKKREDEEKAAAAAAERKKEMEKREKELELMIKLKLQQEELEKEQKKKEEEKKAAEEKKRIEQEAMRLFMQKKAEDDRMNQIRKQQEEARARAAKMEEERRKAEEERKKNTIDISRQTYTRFSKKHMAKEALQEKGLPFEEEVDHFIVKRWVDKEEQAALWARSKVIRDFHADYNAKFNAALEKAQVVRTAEGPMKFVSVNGGQPIAVPVEEKPKRRAPERQWGWGI